MLISLNRKRTDSFTLDKRYSGQEICISFDTSKTNTGICVMNKYYQVLDVVEISGVGEDDVLLLCDNQRKFLSQLFDGAKVLDVGIEDIVTTKEKSLDYHHARFVVTAVFMNVIFTFQSLFGITPTLISNMAWKSAVLPSNLNKKSVYKGSVAYVKNKYPHLITGNKDDDITDAICIGEFMRMSKGVEESFKIIVIPDYNEFNTNECTYRIYSSNSKIDKDKNQEFRYNENKSIEANIDSMASRLSNKKKVGFTKVKSSLIPIEFIYKYSRGKFNEREEYVYLVVARS